MFTLTPLLMIDKKGEKYFSIYACFLALYIKREKEFLFMHIVLFCKKREKNLMGFMLDWHVYLLMFAYMSHVLYCHILLLICYA